MISITKRTDK